MSKEKKKGKQELENEERDEAATVNDAVEASENENEKSDSLESDDQGENLEQQLTEALDETTDLKDKMLRLAADFENYKKRSERERAQVLKYAGEHIFRDMLGVVDNLERAISQGVVEGADSEKNLAALIEGVELTLKSLQTSLEKFEVKQIDGVGELFDPNKQEALVMEPSDTVPANHVVSEYEKGYFYKDRLLRAAKVIVSSGNAES